MAAHNSDNGPDTPEDWIPDQLITRTVAPAPDAEASFAAVVEEAAAAPPAAPPEPVAPEPPTPEPPAPAPADPELERLRDELKLAEERAQHAEQAAERAEQALANWRARGPRVDR